MKQRLYIDTSVFGGYFDEEFEEFTRPHDTFLCSMKTVRDKKFDTVKYMREQRQRLSEQLSKMTTEQIIEYFKRKKTENSVKPGL